MKQIYTYTGTFNNAITDNYLDCKGSLYKIKYYPVSGEDKVADNIDLYSGLPPPSNKGKVITILGVVNKKKIYTFAPDKFYRITLKARVKLDRNRVVCYYWEYYIIREIYPQYYGKSF